VIIIFIFTLVKIVSKVYNVFAVVTVPGGNEKCNRLAGGW